MRLVAIIVSVYSVFFAAQAIAAEPADGAAAEFTPAPQWYLDDVAFLTRDGGRWIASNEAYKSDDEPMDAYLIEWKAGYAGAMSGRLFGVRDDGETGDFWRFHQYWDAGKGEAVVTQFGFGGAVGIGRAWREGDVGLSAQAFYGPDGSVSGVGHHARNLDADTHVTDSFDIVDGEWLPRRTYVWRRDLPNSGAQNTPDQ